MSVGKFRHNFYRSWAMAFTAICILALAFFSSGYGQVQQLGAAQNSTASWTVLVGGQAAIEPQEYGPAGAWQFMRFYPENITVNVGDMIAWKLNGAEPHTVTFPLPGERIPDLIIPENNSSPRRLLNPLAILPTGGLAYNGTALTGSGQMDVQPNFPREYNLTFTKAGEFGYFCAFHSMMKGRVTVQPAGTPYPMAQEQIDRESAELLATDVEAALKESLKAGNVPTHSGPNGTTIYDVALGAGNGSIALMRFFPLDLFIHANDTVEWIQGDVEAPHTITFLSGGQEPQLVLVEPQENGPPKFVLNPAVQNPAGGKVYSGKDYFNSGIIWGTMVPLPGARNYSLTFDIPGDYSYLCIFHDYMGMKGHIGVAPR